jgi:hypothetical protein
VSNATAAHAAARQDTAPSRHVDGNAAEDQDDHDLAREERRVPERSGEPFFPRRQEASAPQRDQQLGGDSNHEQSEQRPQGERVAPGRRHHRVSANIVR